MIEIIARTKCLEPPLTEMGMTNKLAHHFGSGNSSSCDKSMGKDFRGIYGLVNQVGEH